MNNMEFINTISYRCFKCVCLWSLILFFAIVLCFCIGYILTCIAGVIAGNNFAQGFGWLAIVLPTIFAVIISAILFMIANGYLAFILFFEYRKPADKLPIKIIEKTEQLFEKLIKNNKIKKIIFVLSIFSFVLSLFVSVLQIYSVLIGFIAFVILYLLQNKQENKKV